MRGGREGESDVSDVCLERQTRQKELQELEKRLTTSHRDLREEELKMKHKVHTFLSGQS